MTSVSSANSASRLIRFAAPLVTRPVAGVAAAKSAPVLASNSNTTAKPGESPTAAAATAAGAAHGTTSPSGGPSKAELTRQLHALQAKMDKLNPALAFVLDQGSGRTMIQLTDRATQEVVQQFPSEAALQISKALDSYQKGQLIHLKG